MSYLVGSLDSLSLKPLFSTLINWSCTVVNVVFLLSMTCISIKLPTSVFCYSDQKSSSQIKYKSIDLKMKLRRLVLLKNSNSDLFHADKSFKNLSFPEQERSRCHQSFYRQLGTKRSNFSIRLLISQRPTPVFLPCRDVMVEELFGNFAIRRHHSWWRLKAIFNGPLQTSFGISLELIGTM